MVTRSDRKEMCGRDDDDVRELDDCPTQELPAREVRAGDPPGRRGQGGGVPAPPGRVPTRSTLTNGWASHGDRIETIDDDIDTYEADTEVDPFVPHDFLCSDGSLQTQEIEMVETAAGDWQMQADDASLRDTVRDITAIERTQIIDMDETFRSEALARNRQSGADSSDQEALSDLAGAVGHELNNPLTTCVGYLRQISSMVPPENAQMVDMLERLARNLNRIHSIVGELEMLAAESRGRQQRVDLAHVVERVHDQLSRFLKADVTLELSSAYLQCDRPRLYQLVYVMLAAYMLDDDASEHCIVRVSSRSVGACLEIIAACRPQGSLRLDLLGILRRNVLAGATPLGLAAQLTHEMGGSWFEPPVDSGHRVTAILPRQLPPESLNRRPPHALNHPSRALPDHSASADGHTGLMRSLPPFIQ